MYFSSSGHLLLLGKTSKKLKMLLFSIYGHEAFLRCSKLILIAITQFSPLNLNKEWSSSFIHWVLFISAGIWLSQYLYEIVDEIHKEAGKMLYIFSFELNKGMNIFPLMYMYGLV